MVGYVGLYRDNGKENGNYSSGFSIGLQRCLPCHSQGRMQIAELSPFGTTYLRKHLPACSFTSLIAGGQQEPGEGQRCNEVDVSFALHRDMVVPHNKGTAI